MGTPFKQYDFLLAHVINLYDFNQLMIIPTSYYKDNIFLNRQYFSMLLSGFR